MGGMTPARSGKTAENRTKRDSSSRNQAVLATKKFRMTKYREKCDDKHNYIENSCLFVFIPSVQSVAKYDRPIMTNYAKQTQFTKRSNKRKLIYNKGLRKCSSPRTPQKQTQLVAA